MNIITKTKLLICKVFGFLTANYEMMFIIYSIIFKKKLFNSHSQITAKLKIAARIECD
jgi:hypothetical protein